ncbi:MAG: aminodeoxychorismate/anthranilate synthase component II [Candidatus Omnitrophota bacterium]|nr:aminodeoxychorismate/anthranilate synthase component II [Candidatus Omnitrophota bacterium]MBU1928872.1 aminodeoxychorismate/anthranilate synthase component II [Candidatus Omnitrophota bacterium]MBU2034482.1 aminodeoxychorismate/anthranilate synthase component II [Candidatus Omnitrophota bacterium]MBU2221498.1 aminodeoxychorismate/anthranilate synthase component II [Candidatus Omnitrophota bacterium]MBU2258629.1 aminodeoxychorismate/anthranilate synthase component II [Candidatus Omnitrophota
MILMIDNYDSFTYNLVQYLEELGAKVRVFRNDKISLGEIERLSPQRIVISPGPGRPEDAGISCEVIREFSPKIPILGVCLGHQAIGYVCGGKIKVADKIMHGKTSLIYHKKKGIFKGIPNPFEATRYHSLIIERISFPAALEITAWTKDKEVMGLKHKKYPLWGLQFHPESIMTRDGKDILANFLRA